MKRVSAAIVKETSEKMRNACTELLILKEGEHRENVFNPELVGGAVVSDFQQKYLSAEIVKAPVDAGVAPWTRLVAGCCVAAPSPVTSLSLIGGGVIKLLCICGVPEKAPERGRMRLPEQPPLLRLSSGVAGPTVPAGPGGYNTHPILYSAYFAIKRGVFPLLLQKFTQRPSTGDCGISMY